MIPFCCAAGTSFHVTKMLVELLFCPVTLCGAPSGSNKDVQNRVSLLNRWSKALRYFELPRITSKECIWVKPILIEV